MGNYLINDGTCLDGTGKRPRKRTSILVTGNRIAKIGPPDKVRAFAEGEGRFKTVEADGKTIMPGMIDCHCHVSYGDVLSFEELDLYTGVEYRTLRGALACKKVLRAGVTAICAPGGTWNINVALRDAIDCGLIEGPRMSCAGRYISTYNAIGSPWPTWMEHPDSSFAKLCNNVHDMVTHVRREIKDGVDLVKVAGDGDTLTAERTMLGSISFDELNAIADTAHRLGKRCTIHARSAQASADAARAGFDWIIHGSYMSESDLEVVVKHQTPVNPTLSLLANTIDWGPDLGLPDRVLDGYKRELEAASGILTKAHEAGVMIMAGTDSGQGSVPYGEWHAREMEHLITYLGMSNMEAIVAGTRDAAFAVGMEDEIGTLEEGKLADILVVDGDPLADIAVLQDKSRLDVIMKDGEIVDTESPLPEPTAYAWEKPMLYWSDPRMPTQEFVRKHARNKPAWLRKRPQAA